MQGREMKIRTGVLAALRVTKYVQFETPAEQKEQQTHASPAE